MGHPVAPDALGPACWGARVAIAEHVRLDEAALARYAAHLRASPLPMPRWDHPAFPAEAGPLLDAVVLLGNALNYAYWVPDGATMWTWPVAGAPEVDAMALFGRLHDALRGRDADDVGWLQGPEVEGLFDGGTGTQPLIAERVAGLRAFGAWVTAAHGGRLSHLLAAAPDALDLATLLADGTPVYEDRRAVAGLDLPLRKRAQLAAGMLHAARVARGATGLARPERLTLYADYMLPRTLRDLGILVYAPALAAAVDAGAELAAHSPEETALRVATLAAGEALLRAVPGLDAVRLDYALWRAGFGVEARHHRTTTTDY